MVGLGLKACPYGAGVKPVPLYSAGTWGLSQKAGGRLDIAHRRHMRTLMNVKPTHRVPAELLYEKCGAEPVSSKVDQMRRKLFGNIVTMDRKSPSQHALDVVAPKSFGGTVGAPRVTLLPELKKTPSTTWNNILLPLMAWRAWGEVLQTKAAGWSQCAFGGPEIQRHRGASVIITRWQSSGPLFANVDNYRIWIIFDVCMFDTKRGRG